MHNKLHVRLVYKCLSTSIYKAISLASFPAASTVTVNQDVIVDDAGHICQQQARDGRTESISSMPTAYCFGDITLKSLTSTDPSKLNSVNPRLTWIHLWMGRRGSASGS